MIALDSLAYEPGNCQLMLLVSSFSLLRVPSLLVLACKVFGSGNTTMCCLHACMIPSAQLSFQNQNIGYNGFFLAKIKLKTDIWVFRKIGKRAPQKWMVKIMENPHWSMDDLGFKKNPRFSENIPYLRSLKNTTKISKMFIQPSTPMGPGSEISCPTNLLSVPHGFRSFASALPFHLSSSWKAGAEKLPWKLCCHHHPLQQLIAFIKSTLFKLSKKIVQIVGSSNLIQIVLARTNWNIYHISFSKPSWTLFE